MDLTEEQADELRAVEDGCQAEISYQRRRFLELDDDVLLACTEQKMKEKICDIKGRLQKKLESFSGPSLTLPESHAHMKKLMNIAKKKQKERKMFDEVGTFLAFATTVCIYSLCCSDLLF